MTDEQMIEALRALAHPVRLRIMQALSGTERNVGEIDEAAEIGQPTLSQQLAVLRKTDLVTTRREAKLVYYRIDEARVEAILAAIGLLRTTVAGQTRSPHKPVPGAAHFATLD